MSTQSQMNSRKRRTIFRDRWVWRMAWRDGRRHFSRLFLFMASLITGIAAVVAIGSLNYSLQEEIDTNTKELIGADIVVSGNKPLDTAWNSWHKAERVKIARDADLASMALFMNANDSRLVQVTGMEGDFPFYGKMETQPADALARLKTNEYVLLDDVLASRYNLSSGDSVKLGNKIFRVGGVVTKKPGNSALASTIAPSVYISLQALDSTGLIQFGSRVNYSLYVKTESDAAAHRLEEKAKPLTKQLGNSIETVDSRREGLGESFKGVYRFFALLAFVALLLGCIGVASSVHIYAREKRDEVAMLRCIGSSGWQAFNIYFIQVFVCGIVGSMIGAAIGTGIHQFIPLFFGKYLPGKAVFSIAWQAIGEGVLLGALVSILFTILPLVSIRFVPPLTVLRSEVTGRRVVSKTKIAAIVLIVLFPILTAAYQSGSLIIGLAFSGGLAVALGLLWLVATGLLKLIRRFFPSQAPFLWRHALANLFRPNNQTRVLMVTIGLGAFIVSVLNIIQSSLLHQVEFRGNKNQSNTILFDIQPSQKDGVVALAKQNRVTLNQVVPMITCRISSLNGKAVADVLKDSTKIPEWALTREYRVTYRDTLTGSEKLKSGKLQHRGKSDSVFVTISDRMAENLELKVGDSLTFDVQSVPVKTFVSGIREVEWPKDPPNFIFVFPSGAIDQAPQIWVVAARIDSVRDASAFQQKLVSQFPNVSMVDLRLVLNTINELFEKVALVIRFLAMFSIVTGIIVLAGAVVNSKFLRSKEYVLLRTVGARTRQIILITAIEYGYLGLFSALTAMVLAVGGGWALTKFFFEIQFSVSALSLLEIAGAVIAVTMAIGVYNSRDVIRVSPLQAIRREG